MNAVLTLAKREILDRRMVLLAAGVAGLIPLLVPLLPAARLDAATARDVSALFLVAAFGWGSAIVLGASTIGRDLTERRLGFYFARPIPGWAIWWGKLLGTWLIAAGALVLSALPTLLLTGGPFHVVAQRKEGFLFVSGVALGGTLFLVPLAHAASVALRSRSPWIAVDVAALVAVAATVWVCGRTVILSSALGESFGWLVLAPVIAVFGALIAAGLAQVSLGRTDALRGHRMLSTTLWGLLGSFALGLSAYALWVTLALPSSLGRIGQARLAPRGDWLLVEGTSRGRGFASYLLDAGSRRFLRIGTGAWIPAIAFSADGHRAAWLRSVPLSGDTSPELYWADLLGEPTPVRIDIGSHPGAFTSGLALSPDGRRLALTDAGLLSVLELDGARILVSVRLPPEDGVNFRERIRVLFPSPDRVWLSRRIWLPTERERNRVELLELDVAARKLEVTGRFELKTPKPVVVSPNLTGDRLLVIEGPQALSLRDGRTGALLALLALPEGDTLRSLAFLSSGRIAVACGTPAQTRLLLFSVQGALERTLPLGPGRWVSLAGEMAPGKILIGVRSASAEQLQKPWTDGRGWMTYVVDEATGQLAPLAEGLVPVAGQPWWSGAAVPARDLPVSQAGRLYVDEAGRLVRLDATERTILTGR